MKRTSHLWLFLFLCLGLVIPLGVTVAPGAAAAKFQKKRVVVLPFSGPSNGVARRGVASALGRNATQVTPAQFESTGRELGIDPTSAEGVVAVCSKLKCDAVIKGTVRKKGRKFAVALTVLNGGTGEAIGRRAGTARGIRKLAGVAATLGAQCAEFVAQGRFKAAQTVAKARPAAPAGPAPGKAVRTAASPRDTSDVPVYKPSSVAPAPAAEVKSSRRGEGEEDEGVRKQADRGSLAGLFDVSVALGFSSRVAAVSVTNADQGQSAPSDSKYDGGMFPEFTLRADLYPVTFFTRSFFRNIGLGVSYTRHLTISTKMPAKNQQTGADEQVPVSTSSQELLLDLKLRWAILSSPTSPEVTFLAGFGMRDFNLGENTVMPSLNYRFVRLGVEGSVPLWTPLAAVFVGFDARPLLGLGQESVNHLGTKSGGFGFAVRGGAQGRLSLGITYFLVAEFLRFTAEWSGLAADTNNLGPLDRIVPTQGSDRYVRLWAGVGYAM